MNFINKQLTITDDPNFGCTIEFSDSIDNENNTVKELLNSTNKYLMIQRSYPEDEFESDWYTVESSESDTELSYKDKMIISLKRDLFEISWSGDKLIIGLELSDIEYSNLDTTLRKKFKDRIIFIK
ncbi:hypothetical protein ES705_25885 [subsurface metagenome]